MPESFNPKISPGALASSPQSAGLPPDLIQLLSQLGQSGAGPAADALSRRATAPSNDFVQLLLSIVQRLKGGGREGLGPVGPPQIEPQLGQGTIGGSRPLLEDLLRN